MYKGIMVPIPAFMGVQIYYSKPILGTGKGLFSHNYTYAVGQRLITFYNKYKIYIRMYINIILLQSKILNLFKYFIFLFFVFKYIFR